MRIYQKLTWMPFSHLLIDGVMIVCGATDNINFSFQINIVAIQFIDGLEIYLFLSIAHNLYSFYEMNIFPEKGVEICSSALTACRLSFWIKYNINM